MFKAIHQESINHQKQILKNSENALSREPLKRRSHRSITFTCGPENLDEARKLVAEFEQKIVKLMKNGDGVKKEVYQLQTGLYPVTIEEKTND